MEKRVTFEEQIEKEGILFYTLVGKSMMPLLRERRDVIQVEKIMSPLKKFDVVLFRRENRRLGRDDYVLHRILRLNPDGTYWIVGDNCFSGDTVKQEEIIGLLTAVIRDGKKVSFDGFGYRLYLFFFCRLWRIRIALLHLRSLFSRFRRKLFGKKS